MKYLLQKHILWSNFRIWKEGGKKLLDWGKKLSINKSRTMHAHVEILHVQYVLWRLTLNLKPKSLVFYPTKGGKNFKYHFSTLMGDPDQKPFKNKIHTIIFFINQIVCTIFFVQFQKKSWDFIFGVLIFHIWDSLLKFLWEMRF